MINLFKKSKSGFTLIELMVVISIIGLLATIVYASFGEARMQARDKTRMASLKELQLAVELYKAQNGVYPAMGCSAATTWVGPGPATADSWYTPCDAYIVNLVPDYIPSLPLDPRSEQDGTLGFLYQSDGTAYKILLRPAETLRVTSYSDEFARCPARVTGAGSNCPDADPPATTYAVYSAGAEYW